MCGPPGRLGAAEAVLAGAGRWGVVLKGAGRGGVVRVLEGGGGEAQVPAVSCVQAAALLGPARTLQTRQLGGETVINILSRDIAFWSEQKLL